MKTVDDQRRGTDLRLSGDELFAHYVEQAALAMKDSEQPRIRPLCLAQLNLITR